MVQVSFESGENVPKLKSTMVVVTNLCEYMLKIIQLYNLKMVNFIM